MAEEIRVITKAQYDEYMELKKQVADISKTKRWKPALGDTFFLITSTTHIDSMRCLTGNSDVCEKIFKTGNCFKTKEEAQKELDRRIAEQELLDLCDADSGDVAEIYFRSIDSRFAVTVISPCVSSPYHFATKESAKKAIDTIGTEKLKLIFRID